jgi:hypothetical protein
MTDPRAGPGPDAPRVSAEAGAQPRTGADGPSALAAEVILDGRVGADDEQHLIAALTACGVTSQVKIIPPRRDTQALTWIVLIALPLQGFLSSLGQKAAGNAYAAFTNAVQRLLRRHGQRAGPAAAGDSPRVLVLQDPETGLRVIFEPDLPDAAHDQLRALDLSRYRYGPLHYDRLLKRWRSELDEADTARTSS